VRKRASAVFHHRGTEGSLAEEIAGRKAELTGHEGHEGTKKKQQKICFAVLRAFVPLLFCFSARDLQLHDHNPHPVTALTAPSLWRVRD
jgi:hypothetical protein